VGGEKKRKKEKKREGISYGNKGRESKEIEKEGILRVVKKYIYIYIYIYILKNGIVKFK
jgi:hypothetical protein